MKSVVIRFNKEQLKMMVSSIEASIRIAGNELIIRDPDEQKVFDLYALELKKIEVKLLNGIASCD